MIKNKKIVTLILIILSLKLNAQSGSVYTRYGLGDIQITNQANLFGIGGLDYAGNNKKYINYNNPASLSLLKTTRFQTGLTTDGTKISNGTSSAMNYQTKFNGFSLGFPLQKDYGIGFVLGVVPYTNVNYDVIQTKQTTGSENYKNEFKGKGEISKLFFGISYELPLNFSVGATFEYLVGNNFYASSITFENSELTNSNFQTTYKYRGLGTTIGLLSPDIAKGFGVKKFSDVRFGFIYNLFGNINADTIVSSITSLGSNEIKTGKFKIKFPTRFGFGLSFKYNRRYKLNFDYLFQPWNTFSVNNFNKSGLQNFKRYSFGMEYTKSEKKFGTFWELVKYRGGLSYEQTQYSINGKGVNQFSFYGGISLPLGIRNTIDIGLMYGIRGNTNDNLISENIFKAIVSVNLGELWFIRRER